MMMKLVLLFGLPSIILSTMTTTTATTAARVSDSKVAELLTFDLLQSQKCKEIDRSLAIVGRPAGHCIKAMALQVGTNQYTGPEYSAKADFLFDWFGFNQTSKSVVNSTYAEQPNKSKLNRRSVEKRYFYLRSNWMFSYFSYFVP